MIPGLKRASGAMNLSAFIEMVYLSGSSKFLVMSVLSASITLCEVGLRETKHRFSLIFLII
jgi:hypothetical protein